MADAYQLILSTDIVATMETLAACRRLAFGLDPAAEVNISAIIVELEQRLIRLSEETAAFADERIRSKIRLSAKRPETSKGHHLVDSIHSSPLPLGGVEVALISELDKAARDGIPYWRAQEYGLSAGFVGRRLFGTFEPSGTAPHSGASPGDVFNVGITLDPEFVMGSGPGAGKGTIEHPIEARYFLRTGAAQALAFYTRNLRKIEREFVPRIAAAFVP